MPVAARASMLSAHVVPASGGHTEFADMRAAYDALDEATKARIAHLSAYHSIVRSQAKLGFTEVRAGVYGYDVAEPPRRPLVRVHPVTGRRSLFIGRHAYGIPGLEPDESERLLDDLLEFACRPPRVYEHHWQVGDLVVWDNRCMLHRARPWDLAEARLMKHTRVSGDPRVDSAA
jgi:alpha-ketoglutarate-dependent taurine dioxygenase